MSRLIITILNIWLGCGERLQFKHFSFKFFQHLGFFFFLASFVFFFDEILYLRKLYFFQPFCFVLIPIRYAYEEGFFLRPFLKVLDNTVNLMPLSKFHKVPQHLVPTQVIHLPKLFIVKLSFLIVNDFFKDFDGRWIFFFVNFYTTNCINSLKLTQHTTIPVSKALSSMARKGFEVVINILSGNPFKTFVFL